MKRIFLILLFSVFILSGCKEKNTPVVGCIGYAEDNDFFNGVNLCYEEYSNGEKGEISFNIKKIEKDDDVNSVFDVLYSEGADIIISNLESEKNNFNNNEGGIPVISSNDDTAKNSYLYYFGLSPDMEGQYLADFIVNDLKLRTAAIMINVDYKYSVELAEGFDKYFKEKGGEITGSFEYRNSVTDFTQYVNNFSSANPQILLVLDKGEKSVEIIEQAYKLTPVLPTFIGSSQWEDIEKYISNKGAFNNSYYITSFSKDISEPEVQMFLNKYNEKYNSEAAKSSALGYDMAAAAIKTLENAEKIENNSIINELKFLEIKGISGSYKLSGTNNAKRSAYINTIIDGNSVLYMQKKQLFED